MTDESDYAEELVLEHEAELEDQQSRLEQLEDRLEAVLPIANTPQGAAKRLVLEVPTARTVFSIGARGAQRPIGAGGFAFETDKSLAAHVGLGTCVDTDGLTIVHSGGAARILTQSDFGLAASGPLRIG